MHPETIDRIASAIVAFALAFVVVMTRRALPVIQRGRRPWFWAAALAVGLTGAALSALDGTGRGNPVRAIYWQGTPAAPVTPTLPVTATRAISATGTPTPAYVYLQTDNTMRVDACQGLAQVVGTRPPPLAWCNPLDPCDPCPPGGGDVGQGFLLWPGVVWRYRVYQGDTPTPAPTGTPEPTAPCAVVYIIVTATPTATDTPTPTPTVDLIATIVARAVAGTLTALATTSTPTPTDTPTPTATATASSTATRTALPPEATPTTQPRLILFPVLQYRPPTATGRPR